MALIRTSIVSLLALLVSCTDSELDGIPLIDQDGRADGDVVADSVDTTGDVPDTAPDTADTADTLDTTVIVDTNVGCTSNESCRGVLGNLGACDDPICDPTSGACRAERRADCCASDGDCPRLGDPCLSNRCPVPGGGCFALSICNPCDSDDQCPSNDPCSIGRCGGDGECFFEPNPACSECQSEVQCDDNVACTKDACVDGSCIHEPAPGCCILDSECRDEDPCTRDFCRPGSGICGFEQIPGCGTCDASLCDDFDPCTQDICTDLGCQHITDPDCRGCQGDGQCNDGDDCTLDQCNDGRCSHEPAVGADGQLLCACEREEQCDDGNACTRDFCDGGRCVNISEPNLPECGCGGSDCDDFDECTTDFCDGSLCQHVSTPGLPGCDGKCANDMQCPAPDQCSKSFCDVQIGSCVTFSVVDCCSSADQCNDGDQCTADRCLDDGRCLHQEIANCGGCAQGCDDGDECTLDRCLDSTGRCSNEEIPGCNASRCQSDFQCQDASRCTANSCVEGFCQVEAIAGCCRNDQECRDGNRCTESNCEDATCVIEQVDCDDGNPCTLDGCDPFFGCQSVADPGSPECVCTPQRLWVRSFVQGEQPDINIDGSGFGVGWHVDGFLPFSPTQSLHYGDEDGQDYSTGFRTFGRATGPDLQVPESAGGVRLDFMVYLDIDADPELDSFRARLLVGNQNIIIWDRVSIGAETFRKWLPVSVELPGDLAGEQIQIRFVFDSLNGEGNLGRGVFVDDIVVFTTCP